MKAILVAHRVRPPRTHDLVELVEQLNRIGCGLRRLDADCRLLRQHAVATRYPAARRLNEVDARAALSAAERIVAAVEKHCRIADAVTVVASHLAELDEQSAGEPGVALFQFVVGFEADEFCFDYQVRQGEVEHRELVVRADPILLLHMQHSGDDRGGEDASGAREVGGRAAHAVYKIARIM